MALNFKLVNELNESRTIVHLTQFKKYTAKDAAEIAFLYIIALQILSSEFSTIPFAQQYAKKTYNLGAFDNWYFSANDLYVFLYGLKKHVTFKDPAASNIFLGKVHIPVQKFRVWLYSIYTDKKDNDNDRRFLLLMENALKIDDSNYRSMRRLSQEWADLDKFRRELVMTRLLFAFRSRVPRSDLLPVLQRFAKNKNLEIKGALNPEEDQPTGSGISSKIKTNTIATGAALGVGAWMGVNAARDSRSKWRAHAGMKESTQLNELKEILDTSHYGHWITDENKIIPVPMYAHIQIMKKELNLDNNIDDYKFGFELGWVRIVHNNPPDSNRPTSIGIDGLIKDLYRTRNIWLSTALRMDKVYLLYKKALHGRGYNETFDIPKDKQKLIQFINSLKSVQDIKESEELKPLYVCRKVLNVEDIKKWAKEQGFKSILSDLHVTIAYSHKPVNWNSFGNHYPKMKLGGSINRSVIELGSDGAIVLRFNSPELTKRWKEFKDKGCSWQYEEDYKPHVTISYSDKIDPSKIKPYTGIILLGPEEFNVVDDGWASSSGTFLPNEILLSEAKLIRAPIAEAKRLSVTSYIRDNAFNVWVNPTPSQTKALLEKVNVLRAIVTNSKIWIWNAYEAIHEEVSSWLEQYHQENLDEAILIEIYDELDDDGHYVISYNGTTHNKFKLSDMQSFNKAMGMDKAPVSEDSEDIRETTSAGSIATVNQPTGKLIKRDSLFGGDPKSSIYKKVKEDNKGVLHGRFVLYPYSHPHLMVGAQNEPNGRIKRFLTQDKNKVLYFDTEHDGMAFVNKHFSEEDKKRYKVGIPKY